MTDHPSVSALLERASEPSIVEHLGSCPSCRAQARLLTPTGDPDSLPGIEVARVAMSEARRRASISMSWSLHTDGLDIDDLEAGRVLDRYTVEHLLGRGGMGTVYQVRHNQLGSTHALKVMKTASHSMRDRLMREGRAQSRLRHPNVVPVTDVVDVDGAPGLIMELVEGPSLARYLRSEGAPPLYVADRIAQGILRGVRAAHAAGVVHRDLKPANVLLVPTDDGFLAKVTDFGLARSVLPTDVSTTVPGPLGTPAYMAPEQIRDPTRADARSDVFSLGAVLYELLTGHQAFAGADLLETFDRIRSGRHEPLTGLAPDLPSHVVDTVERALRPAPEDRFPDVGTMLDAWRGAPVVSASPRAPARRRRRWPLWVGAGVVAALAAATLVTVLDLVDPPRGRRDDRVVTVPASDQPLRERRLTALPDDLQVYALALSPDGSTLAFLDGRGLFLQPLDQPDARQILADGPLHTVDWFPDGTAVVVSGRIDDVEGTWRVRVADGHTDRLSDRFAAWARVSPDGERLALWAEDDGLFVIPAAGGASGEIHAGSTGTWAAAMTWSPSGEWLATIEQSLRGSTGAVLRLTSADGRNARVLGTDPQLLAVGLAPLAWLAPDTLVFGRSYGSERTTLYALDGASSAESLDAAVPLHTWTGFVVTRVRPSSDGKKLAMHRVSARKQMYLMSTAGEGELRTASPEDWAEQPLGWRSNTELLLLSDQGGGGVYARDLATDAPIKLADETHVARRADEVDGSLYWLRVNKEGSDVQKPDSVRLEAVRRDPDGSTTVFETYEDSPGHRIPTGMKCVATGCVVSRPEGDALRFSRLDAETGAVVAEIGSWNVGALHSPWDVTPDGARLAIVTPNDHRLIVKDLETGDTIERVHDLGMPQSVSWGPGGQSLYVTDFDHRHQECYRVLAVDLEGHSQLVTGSMTRFFHTVLASPDGATLALGAFAFDDDVWLVEDTAELLDTRAGGQVSVP